MAERTPEQQRAYDLKVAQETAKIQKIAGSGVSGVSSVNGHTGAVTITVPTALNQLSSDSTHRTVTDTQVTNWNAGAGSGLALGETNTTAYRGDRGKTAYDHSQSTHAPSNANYYAHPSTHSADIITDGTTNKAYTATEKTKLGGIATSANNYTHPSSHSPSIISQDSNNRFVTDAEKANWNAGSGSGLQLGETNTTAYAGDKGKTAYDHSQISHAPSDAEVNNISDEDAEELTSGGATNLHTHEGMVTSIYEPMVNGDAESPEIMFDETGDIIMVEV